MSLIRVDKITGKSGTDGGAPITFSGNVISIDQPGHILQVVNNSTTSTITPGISYNSLISKEITGVLASSKILIIGTGGGDGYNTSTINIDVKITRGASESDTTVREWDNYTHIEGDSHWRPMPLSVSGLDTSPTTGSITYTIWCRRSGGSAYFRGPEILIFEIAG